MHEARGTRHEARGTRHQASGIRHLADRLISKRFARAASVWVGMSAALISTVASAADRISHLSIHKAGWSFNFLYDDANLTNGSNLPVEFKGIIATRDPGTAIGDNLTVVLFKPPVQAGVQTGVQGATRWTSTTWATNDQATALRSMAVTTAVDDCPLEEVYSDRLLAPPTFNPNALPQNTVPEESFQDGLIASDPVATAIQHSPIRQLVVGYLEDIGYAAARIPILSPGDTDTPCPENPDKPLDTMGNAFRAYVGLMDQDREAAEQAFYNLLRPFTYGMCGEPYIPPTGPPTAPPCQPIDFTYDPVRFGDIINGACTVTQDTETTKTTDMFGAEHVVTTVVRTKYRQAFNFVWRRTVLKRTCDPDKTTISYQCAIRYGLWGCDVAGAGPTSCPPFPCEPMLISAKDSDFGGCPEPPPPPPPPPGPTPPNRCLGEVSSPGHPRP